MTPKQYAPPSVTEMIHRRAWEIMSDGRWYDYERVVAELMKVIPPGMAIRRAKERWEMSANTPKKLEARGGEKLTERLEWRSEDEQIRVGARDWVVATIAARPGHSRPSVYVMDPPNLSRAGSNRHSRFTGRKVKMTGPNRVIKSDQLRGEWLKPVLNHLVDEAVKVKNKWAVAAVRQAAHEQGIHLASCPERCVLNPNVQLEPIE